LKFNLIGKLCSFSFPLCDDFSFCHLWKHHISAVCHTFWFRIGLYKPEF
jgi:hypothetical protein